VQPQPFYTAKEIIMYELKGYILYRYCQNLDNIKKQKFVEWVKTVVEHINYEKYLSIIHNKSTVEPLVKPEYYLQLGTSFKNFVFSLNETLEATLLNQLLLYPLERYKSFENGLCSTFNVTPDQLCPSLYLEFAIHTKTEDFLAVFMSQRIAIKDSAGSYFKVANTGNVTDGPRLTIVPLTVVPNSEKYYVYEYPRPITI
jgi:hypothetical protein